MCFLAANAISGVRGVIYMIVTVIHSNDVSFGEVNFPESQLRDSYCNLF